MASIITMPDIRCIASGELVITGKFESQGLYEIRLTINDKQMSLKYDEAIRLRDMLNVSTLMVEGTGIAE